MDSLPVKQLSKSLGLSLNPAGDFGTKFWPTQRSAMFANMQLLLVEDDSAMRTTLQRTLMRRGLHVEVAADGPSAHLLLQTRTRALDGTLRPLFERWYPGLANDNTASGRAAAA